MIARMSGGINIDWTQGENLINANKAFNDLSNYIDQS